MAISKEVIELQVKGKGITLTTSQFKKLEKEVAKVGAKAKQTGDKMDFMRIKTSGVRRTLGAIRNQLLVVAFAFGGLIRVLNKSFEAYKKQLEAEQQLTAGLRNVAGTTRAATQELIRYASILQKATTFGDENIISGMAMLSTFQLNSKAIKQITPRMIDMAAAAKQAGASENDLKSIAIALGKGLTGQVGILGRYGVVIDKVGLELARSKGKTAEFNFILKELDKNFKGIAEELKNSTIGQITQMEMKIGDLSEEVGKAYTPIKLLFAQMKLGATNAFVSILKLGGAIQTSSNAIVNSIEDERVTFVALIKTLQDVSSHEVERKNAIDELQLNYSGYIGNIDLETASNEDLLKSIRDVNKAYETKLELAYFEIELADIRATRDALVQEHIDLRKELENVYKPKESGFVGLIPTIELDKLVTDAKAIELRDRIEGVTADIHALSIEMFDLKENFLKGGGILKELGKGLDVSKLKTQAELIKKINDEHKREIASLTNKALLNDGIIDKLEQTEIINQELVRLGELLEIDAITAFELETAKLEIANKILQIKEKTAKVAKKGIVPEIAEMASGAEIQIKKFSEALAQAAIYGQNMGEAVVSALRAIAAELLAQAIGMGILKVAQMAFAPMFGGLFKGMFDGVNSYNDFIWRAGQDPIAISPQDNIVGTKSTEGVASSPPINITVIGNLDDSAARIILDATDRVRVNA